MMQILLLLVNFRGRQISLGVVAIDQVYSYG